jgi:hypothetical protein
MTINQGAIGRESADDPISSYLSSYLSEIPAYVGLEAANQAGRQGAVYLHVSHAHQPVYTTLP